jgi:hypothetical protein
LVIEAAHSCYRKLLAAKSTPKPLPGIQRSAA